HRPWRDRRSDDRGDRDPHRPHPRDARGQGRRVVLPREAQAELDRRRMIRTLLIANRGEIACRVARTARRMGIRVVAVYSDADRDALHVAMADAAVHIGEAPPRESYLRADRILDAARATGAD